MNTRVKKALRKAGANVLGWTQDGQFDAVKIQVLVNNVEFEVSVEAEDNLIVMYPDYTFTYDHKTAAEAYAVMAKWEK